MNKLLAQSAYEYDVHENEMLLHVNPRLFLLKDINSGKRLLTYLKKNNVTTLVCNITQVQSLDSNTESLLYQIASYFAEEAQKNVLLKANSQSQVQNRLVSNLYKLNPNLQFEFSVE